MSLLYQHSKLAAGSCIWGAGCCCDLLATLINTQVTGPTVQLQCTRCSTPTHTPFLTSPGFCSRRLDSTQQQQQQQDNPKHIKPAAAAGDVCCSCAHPSAAAAAQSSCMRRRQQGGSSSSSRRRCTVVDAAGHPSAPVGLPGEATGPASVCCCCFRSGPPLEPVAAASCCQHTDMWQLQHCLVVFVVCTDCQYLGPAVSMLPTASASTPMGPAAACIACNSTSLHLQYWHPDSGTHKHMSLCPPT